MFVEHIGKKGNVLKRTTKISASINYRFCTSCKSMFTKNEIKHDEWPEDLAEGMLWCGGCKRVISDIYFGRKNSEKV